MKTKHILTLEAAKAALSSAESEAAKNGWTMAVAVVDDGGNLVGFSRMDGAQIASIQIAIDKAKAAIGFRRPTKALEDIVAAGRVAFLSVGSLPIEGGVPLIYNGDMVGAIGASGGMPVQDGATAQAGAAALAG
ncbi:MAG: heme-binding protein [Hyphomicrobiaceae bacterium]|nr:heme-binding protein [Hyphomicrobiaceae bacterium]